MHGWSFSAGSNPWQDGAVCWDIRIRCYGRRLQECCPPFWKWPKSLSCWEVLLSGWSTPQGKDLKYQIKIWWFASVGLWHTFSVYNFLNGCKNYRAFYNSKKSCDEHHWRLGLKLHLPVATTMMLWLVSCSTTVRATHVGKLFPLTQEEKWFCWKCVGATGKKSWWLCHQ